MGQKRPFEKRDFAQILLIKAFCQGLERLLHAVKGVILFSQLANILTFRLGELCPKKLPQPVMFKKKKQQFQEKEDSF